MWWLSAAWAWTPDELRPVELGGAFAASAGLSVCPGWCSCCLGWAGALCPSCWAKAGAEPARTASAAETIVNWFLNIA